MKIKVKFFPNDYIVIDLFDNTTITKWVNHFKNYKYTRFPQLFGIQPPYWAFNRSIVKNWNTIKQNLIDISLPDKFNRDQQLLNQIHRLFTSNVSNATDREPWYSINYAVHYLELFTVPADNKKFVDSTFPIFGLELKINDAKWLEFNNEDILLNYQDMDQPNLVYLNGSILGKSYLRSFYDNDDPTAVDCTGRLGSYGGFVIDINNNRQLIYQSAQFKDWASKYNLDVKSLPLEFPIGKVVETTKSIKYFTWCPFFKGVEFLP